MAKKKYIKASKKEPFKQSIIHVPELEKDIKEINEVLNKIIIPPWTKISSANGL